MQSQASRALSMVGQGLPSHPGPAAFRETLTLLLLRLSACLMLVIAAKGFGQSTGQPSEVRFRESVAAHLGAGYDDLKNSRYEAAAAEFRAALTLDPRLVLQARFPLAVCLFELHRDEEARHEFEAVRREAGDQPNVEYYLGRLDLAEGRLEASIAELQKAASKPPFPDTAYYLGTAYWKRHNLALAEKWLRVAAEADPLNPAVPYELGALYAEAGRKDESAQAYARSEQLRQRQAETDRLRIECTSALDQGPPEAARAVCDRLFDPEDVERLTILGTLYGQHGDYAAALKPLARAAELRPNSPQMQYNLAFDYFQLHRYQQARDPLVKAAERWPDLFPVNALLGVVLERLGEDQEAYRTLHHAYELRPQDQATASALYRVALRLGEKSLADKQYAASQRYLSEAARLRPGEAEPHRLLAESYSALGRQAEAAEERRQLARAKSSDH
jgi:tetratricopeptide (TPR) repeat protein